MKSVTLIISLLSLVIVLVSGQLQKVRVEEPQFVLTYKLYLSDNDTYTIIDILDYTNITLAWGLQSQLNITWINNDTIRQFNNNASIGTNNTKKALILTNNSVTPFLHTPNKISLQNSQYNFTNKSSKPDLLILALSNKQ